MKVRVVLTLDVDPERMRDRYPFAVERAGGVAEATRSYVRGAVLTSDAVARHAVIRGAYLAE